SVRHGDELELQRAAARVRSSGGRRRCAAHPATRDIRRTVRARAALADVAKPRVSTRNTRVRIRNNARSRVRKPVPNVAKARNVATMQAAGANGFVKGGSSK